MKSDSFDEYYDINTPVTLGRFRFTAIKNIPKSYIIAELKSFKNGKLKEFLKEYIKTEEIIETEVKTCWKKTFTKEDAIKSRDKLNMTSRLKKKQIILRVYQCEVCDFYHLTSKKLKNE